MCFIASLSQRSHKFPYEPWKQQKDSTPNIVNERGQLLYSNHWPTAFGWRDELQTKEQQLSFYFQEFASESETQLKRCHLFKLQNHKGIETEAFGWGPSHAPPPLLLKPNGVSLQKTRLAGVTNEVACQWVWTGVMFSVNTNEICPAAERIFEGERQDSSLVSRKKTHTRKVSWLSATTVRLHSTMQAPAGLRPCASDSAFAHPATKEWMYSIVQKWAALATRSDCAAKGEKK